MINLKKTLHVFGACMIMAGAGHAESFTWDGGYPTGNRWTQAANWVDDVNPTSSNITDLIFADGSVDSGNTYNNWTARSLTFDETVDADGHILNVFRSAAFQRTLTLEANSGNSTVTVSSGSTGNISINAVNTGANAGDLKLNNNLDVVHNGSGNLTFNLVINEQTGEANGITKSGIGTMILTDANTYTGATVVTAGKLIVNGDQSGATGAVTVASGASLGGDGKLGGALDVTGILAPGSGGIGTLTAGETTWNGASTSTVDNLWQFDLSATSDASDTLAILGDFKKDSAGGTVYKFDFMSSAPTTWGNVYTLVTWTGVTDFLATDFSWTNLGGSHDGQPGTGFTIIGNSLTFTAVPEPTSALAGLLLTAGLLRRRRA